MGYKKIGLGPDDIADVEIRGSNTEKRKGGYKISVLEGGIKDLGIMEILADGKKSRISQNNS